MLFSGKENVFMYLVAFLKIFRKIFSSVWKRRRKRQTQKNTDKTQIDAWRSIGFDGTVLRELQSDDRAVDRDLAKHRATSRDRSWRSRDRYRCEREIAIDGAISWSVERDLAKRRIDHDRREGKIAIDGAGACERSGLELGACEWRWCVRASPSLSLSLSLSLSMEFIWSENRNGNSFP